MSTMDLRERDPIDIVDTPMFKKWLAKKGIAWPSGLIEQENVMSQFIREGIEEARQDTKEDR